MMSRKGKGAKPIWWRNDSRRAPAASHPFDAAGFAQYEARQGAHLESLEESSGTAIVLCEHNHIPELCEHCHPTDRESGQ